MCFIKCLEDAFAFIASLELRPSIKTTSNLQLLISVKFPKDINWEAYSNTQNAHAVNVCSHDVYSHLGISSTHLEPELIKCSGHGYESLYVRIYIYHVEFTLLIGQKVVIRFL